VPDREAGQAPGETVQPLRGDRIAELRQRARGRLEQEVRELGVGAVTVAREQIGPRHEL
jgi:hypothetical protein